MQRVIVDWLLLAEMLCGTSERNDFVVTIMRFATIV